MPVKGVNPSYFAGMPTVALDPNAGKQNPQYAQMLSQAMQNRSSQAARRRESDEDNAFKARNLDQQARRDRKANEISKRNTAVSEAGEARLKSGQDFAQDRLKMADTRDLLHALRRAQDAKDYTAVSVFSKALRERGYKVDEEPEPDEDFAKRMPQAAPPAPPDTGVYGGSREQFERDMAGSQAAPPIPKGLNPPPTARFPDAGEGAAASPMRAAPPGASPPPPPAGPRPGPVPVPPSDGIPLLNKTQDMSWIEGKQPPLSMPPRQMASDNAQFYDDMNWHPPTEKELLDRAIADVVAREAKPLLPGKSLRRRAAESDQMLSPDDPLLQQKPRAQ